MEVDICNAFFLVMILYSGRWAKILQVNILCPLTVMSALKMEALSSSEISQTTMPIRLLYVYSRWLTVSFVWFLNISLVLMEEHAEENVRL
jgi:hypothetical protein